MVLALWFLVSSAPISGGVTDGVPNEVDITIYDDAGVDRASLVINATPNGVFDVDTYKTANEHEVTGIQISGRRSCTVHIL